MASTVQQMEPGAHVPFLLGVLRRWEGATRMDQLLPPHPAHGRSCGRGRRPRPWRYHTGRDRIVADPRRQRRARRGRPAKRDTPPRESS